MVVGGSGFLGRAVVKRLWAYTVVATYNRTTIPSAVRYNFFEDDVRAICDAFGIDTVIFAAAIEKEVSGDFEASVGRFLRGVQDRRLVYLSSDAVFSGEKGLYTERDTPNPVTRYGRNLLHFETRIKEIHPDYCIIRPSYIYGVSDGLDTRLAGARAALASGREVARFGDMFKSPLGVAQVAEAVVALGLSDFTGVVHVAGERLSNFDFYYRALTALGVNVDALQREKMPKNSSLPRDTSLDTSLWQQLTGMTPLSIEATLERTKP